MTITKISEKKQKNRMLITQSAVFVSAISILSTMNLSHSFVEMKRPAVLLAALVFALFDFKKIKSLSTLQRIILLYIIALFFNQLCERFVHLGGFSIHLPVIVMMPLVVSFMCSRFQGSNCPSIETDDLLKSCLAVFAIIIFHMLFLFLLLRNIYGYGYEHNFGVLANLCLYFLVFIFSWQQLENITLRRITSLVFIFFFIVIVVKGF